MAARPRGRPRTFDRDRAVLEAARLFWRQGYSGTSTRALTAALGISSSSLYAAFGSKAGLFEEAVRTYAQRYSEIYRRAVAEPRLDAVVERVLVDSIDEFTRPLDDHPGCLTRSAAMTDGTETFDVRAFVAERQRADEELLRARFERAARDGELPAGADVDALVRFVQAVWEGLSARSGLGEGRDALLAAARLALRCVPAPSGGPR